MSLTTFVIFSINTTNVSMYTPINNQFSILPELQKSWHLFLMSVGINKSDKEEISVGIIITNSKVNEEIFPHKEDIPIRIK